MGAEFRLGYGSFNAMRAAGFDRPAGRRRCVRVALRRLRSRSPTAITSSAPTTVRSTRSTCSAARSRRSHIPGITGTTGEGSPNKSAGGEDNINGRIKAQWTPDGEPDVPRAVRDHARSFRRGAGIQRHAAGRPVPLELPRLHASARRSARQHGRDASATIRCSRWARARSSTSTAIYLNMEWDLGSGTFFANRRQARPGRAPAEHVPGRGAGQHGHRRSDLAVRRHARHDPRNDAVRSALRLGLRRPGELRRRRVPADQRRRVLRRAGARLHRPRLRPAARSVAAAAISTTARRRCCATSRTRIRSRVTST